MIHTCKFRWSLHSVCSSLMRYAKLLRHLKILMIHMCASPCFCCETADFWQTKRTMIYQTYFSSGKQIINSRHSCSRKRCTTIMNKVRSYTHAYECVRTFVHDVWTYTNRHVNHGSHNTNTYMHMFMWVHWALSKSKFVSGTTLTMLLWICVGAAEPLTYLRYLFANWLQRMVKTCSCSCFCHIWTTTNNHK